MKKKPITVELEGRDAQPMPNPSEADLESPVFEAIWQGVKTWDVNVPAYYIGYCGANGNHVKLILNALEASGLLIQSAGTTPASPQTPDDVLTDWHDEAKWGDPIHHELVNASNMRNLLEGLQEAIKQRNDARAELRNLKDLLIEVRRDWKFASGARGQQFTIWDSFETYLKSLPKKPSYEDEIP